MPYKRAYYQSAIHNSVLQNLVMDHANSDPTETSLPGVIRSGDPHYSYEEAEQQFNALLMLEDLDMQVKKYPELISSFEACLALALSEAYTENPQIEPANQFLQRLLYRINRLNLFWYDALEEYTNERSFYVAGVRDRH